MSDMYFDTDSFYFESLVDVVETPAKAEKPYTTTEDIDQDGGVISDASDLFDPEELEQEESEVDPTGISDLVDSDAENADIVRIINDLPDDIPLDINGKTFTKAQLSDLTNRADEVTARDQWLDKQVKDFDEANEYVEMQILTRESAIDKNIAYLERMLDHPSLSSDDYKQYSKDLREAKAMKDDIITAAKDIVTARKQQQNILTQRRFADTDIAMTKIHPQYMGWRDQIIDYMMKDMGFSPEYVIKNYDKNLAQMAIESMMFRKSRTESQNKAREAARQKAVKSAPGAVSANRKQQDQKTVKANAVKKKIAKGEIERGDMGAWFDIIPD
ncbi:hypothetical protein CTP45_07785 [Salmonella enterica]|uniref:Scaffolding protein n=1 Tax=Salmonella enterica subsp. enterica serovar Saintpaul TaxID=90105 RepID=A0A5U9IAS6_SALET|nr:hypothetical protein [Salmonella enterica]EBS2301357.1 hypothetical protein [Salmonella enterica subsp. enterica serovar Saintpaul]EDW0017491.1 hypothetical protein [Salmonella enterica subsp. enterica serovar Aba]HCZ4727717.1 hypothetical protein [Salmonella enterica subsp. enterica serovar Saintpaul str. CFSAN004137]EBA1053864.1 hypothetical protein [Salmonella enterica]